MIHDAKVEVTCDGEHCMESIEVEPEFVYPDYSGKNGYYNTKDSALEKLIEQAEWQVKDGKHFCEGCQDDEPEDDED